MFSDQFIRLTGPTLWNSLYENKCFCFVSWYLNLFCACYLFFLLCNLDLQGEAILGLIGLLLSLHIMCVYCILLLFLVWIQCLIYMFAFIEKKRLNLNLNSVFPFVHLSSAMLGTAFTWWDACKQYGGHQTNGVCSLYHQTYV